MHSTTAGRISQYWWSPLFLTGLAMEELQSTKPVFAKKTVQDGSGTQMPTLLPSVWSGMFVISLAFIFLAVFKNILMW